MEAFSRIGDAVAQDRFAKQAGFYLDAFGHPMPSIVADTLKNGRLKLLLDTKWAAMLESCDGALPRIEYPDPWSGDGLSALPGRLTEAGYDRTARFVEELLAEGPQGPSVLGYLVARASAETAKHPPEQQASPGC